MDFAQDFLPLLQKLLPPSLLSKLISTISASFGLLKALGTHLSSSNPSNPFRIFTNANNPDGVTADFTTLLLLAAGLFISLKIFNIVFNAVMFWVRLVFRILFWGSITVLGLYVYYRGLEGTMHDAVELGRYWLNEYDSFKSDVHSFRQQKEQQILREQKAREIRDQQRNKRWW